MQGLRKIVYCIVFGFLELIFLLGIKLSNKELNEWEAIVLIAILAVYPLLNTASKLFQRVFDKNVIKTISSVAKAIKGIRRDSYEGEVHDV